MVYRHKTQTKIRSVVRDGSEVRVEFRSFTADPSRPHHRLAGPLWGHRQILVLNPTWTPKVCKIMAF